MTSCRINFYICDDLNGFFNRFAVSGSKLEDVPHIGYSEEETGDNIQDFIITFSIDGYFLSLFLTVFNNSVCYKEKVKRHFINILENIALHRKMDVCLRLVEPRADLLDYKWNYRVVTLVKEKQQLEHSMSWLSTLGGAFSALGDNFEHCAKVAGEISLHQFQIALKLGEPPLVARCKLYMALSLIQQKKLKVAKRIIEEQHKVGKCWNDFKLINMCKGIWAKLKYSYILEQLKKEPLIV